MKNKIFLSILLLSVFTINVNAEVIALKDIYKAAIINSNKLQSSKFQFESKKEDINQVRSRLYPQINFTIDYNNVDFKRNDNIRTTQPEVNEKSLDYILSLQQTLYSHETYTSIDLEKKRVELFELNLQQEELDLSQEVLSVYLEALKSKNKMQLLDSYLQFNKEKLKMIKKKYSMQLIDKMELLKSQVELNRSKIDLQKEKKLYKIYISKLQQLTNIENIDLPSINFENFNLKIFPSKNKILENKENYLSNNLELVGAKRAIDLSQLDIKNSKSAHYPKLTFDARMTKYNSSDETPDYENYYKYSLQLQIPIYQGGAIESKVQSKKLVKKASIEDMKNIKKDLEISFKELATRIEASTQSVSVYKEALYSAKSYLEFISVGVKNGLKSSLDLYDAKNKVYEIEYEYIQNIQEFIQAYVEFLILTNDLEKLELVDKVLVLK